jgi:hypothetical protein
VLVQTNNISVWITQAETVIGDKIVRNVSMCSKKIFVILGILGRFAGSEEPAPNKNNVLNRALIDIQL